ncbi:ParA family protein [Paucibacter sp. APW11]|uniref:ParA family protein n=1 Tax=Roseateles aquae TaxID=3077235 RepID=A0ABU3P9U8_9BURK|nr:ParA family protein [Paucibacter sp. APW11]MDT8999298.1 ParA family protein [Paucibacter sp. APW11]
MPVILVANPKGGVGKSTLASNVAGYLARQGHGVALGDADVQQSSRQWLALRPAELPAILPLDIDGKQVARPPKGVSHVVLDTPAGLHGKRLAALHAIADRVLIPLQPSLFDIQATYAFVQTLHDLRRDSGRSPALALVGMRAREGTLALQQLQQFMQGLDLPVLGLLRDTQNYVQLAARGLTLWDVASGRVERDLAQWQALTPWLDDRN